MLETFDTSTS